MKAGVTGVVEAIRAVEVSVMYLPPYSPDLNLIEQVFAKPRPPNLDKRPCVVLHPSRYGRNCPVSSGQGSHTGMV